MARHLDLRDGISNEKQQPQGQKSRDWAKRNSDTTTWTRGNRAMQRGGRAWGCLRKKNQEELDKMQQPGILKICRVPKLPGVPAPSLNCRLWASPQPRLFRPLSTDFTPPPTALAPRLGSAPLPTGHVQGRLPASLRPISNSVPPALQVPVRPGPSPSPSPPPQLRAPPSPARPGARRPRPRPELRPLGSYQLVPPPRRKRRAANWRLPHCGRAELGGWDLRLQVRLG